MIRVLTMRRPWAELLVNGRKTQESRRGPVLNRHVGPLAIHVSAKSPGWEKDAEELRRRFGLTDDDLNTPFPIDGCVIGTVVVGRTVRLLAPYSVDAFVRFQDAAVFADIEGRYLSALTQPEWLAAPIPAKGRLGLWNFDLEQAS